MRDDGTDLRGGDPAGDRDDPGTAERAPGSGGDDPGRKPHLTPSQRRDNQPKRIAVPWWALTGICALLGFALAEWLGAVVAGTLGFFAWKLR